jgi:hypothetical protein
MARLWGLPVLPILRVVWHGHPARGHGHPPMPQTRQN